MSSNTDEWKAQKLVELQQYIPFLKSIDQGGVEESVKIQGLILVISSLGHQLDTQKVKQCEAVCQHLFAKYGKKEGGFHPVPVKKEKEWNLHKISSQQKQEPDWEALSKPVADDRRPRYQQKHASSHYDFWTGSSSSSSVVRHHQSSSITNQQMALSARPYSSSRPQRPSRFDIYTSDELNSPALTATPRPSVTSDHIPWNQGPPCNNPPGISEFGSFEQPHNPMSDFNPSRSSPAKPSAPYRPFPPSPSSFNSFPPSHPKPEFRPSHPKPEFRPSRPSFPGANHFQPPPAFPSDPYNSSHQQPLRNRPPNPVPSHPSNPSHYKGKHWTPRRTQVPPSSEPPVQNPEQTGGVNESEKNDTPGSSSSLNRYESPLANVYPAGRPSVQQTGRGYGQQVHRSNNGSRISDPNRRPRSPQRPQGAGQAGNKNSSMGSMKSKTEEKHLTSSETDTHSGDEIRKDSKKSKLCTKSRLRGIVERAVRQLPDYTHPAVRRKYVKKKTDAIPSVTPDDSAVPPPSDPPADLEDDDDDDPIVNLTFSDDEVEKELPKSPAPPVPTKASNPSTGGGRLKRFFEEAVVVHRPSSNRRPSPKPKRSSSVVQQGTKDVERLPERFRGSDTQKKKDASLPPEVARLHEDLTDYMKGYVFQEKRRCRSQSLSRSGKEKRRRNLSEASSDDDSSSSVLFAPLSSDEESDREVAPRKDPVPRNDAVQCETIQSSSEADEGTEGWQQGPEELGFEGRQLFICGNMACAETAETEKALEDHLMVCDLARDSPMLVCKHCGSSSKQVAGLIAHLKQHGIRRYKCGLCSYRGLTARGVNSHLRRIHKETGKIVSTPKEPGTCANVLYVLHPQGWNRV